MASDTNNNDNNNSNQNDYDDVDDDDNDEQKPSARYIAHIKYRMFSRGTRSIVLSVVWFKEYEQRK